MTKKLLIILLIVGILAAGWWIWNSQKEIVKPTPPNTEISEQQALELANQLIQPKCGVVFMETEKVDWSVGEPGFLILKERDICPTIDDYKENKIWRMERLLDENIEAIGFVGLYGEFVCVYALDRRAAPGIMSLDSVCVSREQVTITTDKTEYEQGEVAKITISKTNGPIYVSFGSWTSFYQLKGDAWDKLTLYCKKYCIDDVCENNVLKPGPCPQEVPPQYLYHEYKGPWDIQWDQTECIYETKLCGDETYAEGSLKQVSSGEYKVEFCYFNEEDVDLSKRPGYAPPDKEKCTENEFTIKEKERKVTITTDKTEYEPGEVVRVVIENNLKEPIWYVNECGKEPLDVFKEVNEEWEQIYLSLRMKCLKPLWSTKIEVSTTEEIVYGEPGFLRIFESLGKYKIGLKYSLVSPEDEKLKEPKTIYSNEFTIHDCEELDAAECFENDECQGIYGSSYCSPDGMLCTDDMVFKSCGPSGLTSEEINQIKTECEKINGTTKKGEIGGYECLCTKPDYIGFYRCLEDLIRELKTN